jgi:hypothetical protein
MLVTYLAYFRNLPRHEVAYTESIEIALSMEIVDLSWSFNERGLSIRTVQVPF